MYVLTDADVKQLERVLHAIIASPAVPTGRCRRAKEQLEQVLAHAIVVPSPDVPADVVTLESRLVIRDQRTGQQRVLRMHLPANAVELTPMLAAVLGHRIGDEVECDCSDPPCCVELQRMEYQPESAEAR